MYCCSESLNVLPAQKVKNDLIIAKLFMNNRISRKFFYTP